MPIDAKPPLMIWRLGDGKPGHEKQSQGLADALMRLTPASTHTIKVGPRWKNLGYWLGGRFPPGAALPDPDLILAAGHATHGALLAARRARGGKAVVLMKPSLPLGWFDLCLIPEHDHPPALPSVITTRGALNTVIPSQGHEQGQGLILVGGPSPHYRWDDHGIAGQIATLVTRTPGIHWTLTTSRRTPPEFPAMLPAGQITVVPGVDTPAGWLEQQLARVGQAWVTPDSASMLYEALTAGCRVGVFDLPAVPRSRVAAGVAARIGEGWVRTLGSLGAGQAFPPPAESFSEADRCAAIILQKWFS